MKNNKLDRIFFLGTAIWFLVVIIWGFSPSFYFRSAAQESLRMPLIYHGIFATCWFIIFFTQCLLLNTSKYRKFHFRLGWVGLFILFATFISGVIATFTQVGDKPESIGDSFMHFLLVLGFAGIGILYRKTPFVHKRLLIFGSAILSSAAVARIDFFGFKIGASDYTYYIFMFAAVIALIIYDLSIYKKIFKVSLLSSIISYIMLIHSHYIWESKVWSDFVYQIVNK